MKKLTLLFALLISVGTAHAQTTGPATSLAPTTEAVKNSGNDWQLIAKEPAPGAPDLALAGAGAGNTSNGVHRVRVTFTTAAGHSQAGAISGIVTVVDKTLDGKIAISGIPTGSSFVTGRKVYMTLAGGTVYHLLSNGTIANNTATTLTANDSDVTLAAAAVLPNSNTTSNQLIGYNGDTGALTIAQTTAAFTLDNTIAGSTGAQTINKPAGQVQFAGAATSLVVTNSLVTANSIIIATVQTNDTTMKSAQAVAGSGSFTLFPNAAPTGTTKVGFVVIN